MPPSTARIGTSSPNILSVPGECHIGVPSGVSGRSLSGLSLRNRITEMWATVNESVAPNA